MSPNLKMLSGGSKQLYSIFHKRTNASLFSKFKSNEDNVTLPLILIVSLALCIPFGGLPVLYNLIPILCVMTEAASVKWINWQMLDFKKNKVFLKFFSILSIHTLNWKYLPYTQCTLFLKLKSGSEWVLTYANKKWTPEIAGADSNTRKLQVPWRSTAPAVR